MKLDLYAKRICGQIRLYPVCKTSTALCSIKGTPTLTKQDVATLTAGGFKATIFDEKGAILK